MALEPLFVAEITIPYRAASNLRIVTILPIGDRACQIQPRANAQAFVKAKIP